MKLLITTLTMIFVSFGASAKNYDWKKYGASDLANYYYDDVNVFKDNYTLFLDCANKTYPRNCSSKKYLQSITLNELVSFKETQTFEGKFRYKSLINKKTYDCKRYKYYIHNRGYYKQSIIYNNTLDSIRRFNSFSDQDENKFPQLKENRLLEAIVKKLCKSFYPNGAKIFSQKLINGKPIRVYDRDRDCRILTSPTAIASDKINAQQRLIDRGLIPSSGNNSYCYKVLEPPVEIK